MRRWHDEIRDDHEVLQALTEDVEAALTTPDVTSDQRQGALVWITETLQQTLDAHLTREDALIEILAGVLGDGASATALLKAQHQELRLACRQLRELLHSQTSVNWMAVRYGGQWLVDLVEDHEKTVDRLLLDVLEFSLSAAEQDALVEVHA